LEEHDEYKNEMIHLYYHQILPRSQALLVDSLLLFYYFLIYPKLKKRWRGSEELS
jgi:hypothetical protein